MTKTTIPLQIEVTPDAAPVTPVTPPANGKSPKANGHVPKSLNDPIIPDHPLAPLAGKYANEPLWDDFQEAIREYRQRMNEQEDE